MSDQKTLVFRGQKVFTGDDFNIPTFKALVTDIHPEKPVYLTAGNMKNLRSKLNRYCRIYGLAGTTTKINDHVLEFTHGGYIRTKKDRTKREFEQAMFKKELEL
jgi:hypothetical protein